MKKLFLVVLVTMSLGSISPVKSQISLNINIGSQPLWGPVGYDYVDYYYLPDIDAYYNVPTREYVYLNNGSWKFAKNLPSRYSNFDLYSAYKVVLNGKNPYYNHSKHLVEYRNFKNYNKRQEVIRDSRDVRYSGVKSLSKPQVIVKNNKPVYSIPSKSVNKVPIKRVEMPRMSTNNSRNNSQVGDNSRPPRQTGNNNNSVRVRG